MAVGFRIAARTLKHLGGELITSDDVALNELIKNAFDARSPRVQVRINAAVDLAALELIGEQVQSKEIDNIEATERVRKSISEELPPEERMLIIAEAKKCINRHEFANFLKSLRSQQYITVEDKGYGMTKDDLSDRFLVIGTPGKLKQKKNALPGEPALLGEKGIGRLSMMRLGGTASVESTTDSDKAWHKIDFKWSDFDDPDLYLDQISVEVKKSRSSEPGEKGTRIVITDLTSNWTQEKVDAFIHRYMRRLQDPFAPVRKPYPIDIYFNGKRQPISSLPKWLKDCAQFTATIQFDPAGLDGTDVVLRRALSWRATSSEEIRTWSRKELSNQLNVSVEVFQQLGSWTARCLWFNRKSLTTNEVDYNRNQIADELNHWCGGFAIYRDNFRIGKTGGMDDDWLEWDSGALKSKGFALNRYQTVGSVSISSEMNPCLIDSANRERLIACPQQEVLRKILGGVVVQDLRMHINTIKEAEAKMLIAEESTNESLRKSEDKLKKTIKIVNDIAQYLPKEHKGKLLEIRETLHSQVEYVNTIKNSLSLSRETRVELLELANIGLVVEIVIHELSRLTERTGELLTELKESGDREVVTVVDNLRAQIISTNKRIRTVDAMSPSGRNRKERYDLVAQVAGIAGGFKNRFKRHQINSSVYLDGMESNEPLNVFMVKGLIAQTLENLITNSVYWVQQGLKPGEKEREIRFDVDSRALTVSITDNGPGVDPRYAKEIFKPYFSMRRKGKGLGLYIASELVQYHGGKIFMDESVDDDGRQRTFTIELPKDEV
ncbi:histidine kinase [Pseudomonas sp. FBF18]|uniref:ATP-binding protein n=1 Tax=Pseudomonas TaxID=286 RepID=UPI001F2703EF|nr:MULTISPECIES: ATP-binding protein [Pseudomonas]MCP8349397.1 histidine kinase [Pseudomonas sp. FBF18]